MVNETNKINYSPSLMWVLPIACSIWIGVLVDGWFARPSVRNPVFFAVDPTFEVMSGPALVLLGVWFLMSPARMAVRIQALLFVFVSSLPIAYFAHQRPGQGLSTVWETMRYYADRYYALGTKWVQMAEFLFAIAVAAFSLLLLNRLLSQVYFHRVPVESATSAKRFQQRLSDAFWTSVGSESDRVATQRWEDRVLIASGLSLLAIGIGYLFLSDATQLDSLVKTGLLFGCTVYLCVWAASECHRPWVSFLILWIGVTGLASIPQVARLASSFGRVSTAQELLFCVSSITFSTVLGGVSLWLLRRSHQMPRRTKKLPWSKLETTTEARVAQPTVSRFAFWTTGLALCGLFTGGAYWIPQNIDAENLTDEKQLSLRDGWLAAKLLDQTKGARSRFAISRDLRTDVPTVLLKLPLVDDYWMSVASLVEQRSKEGDKCSLEIESPVADLEWLERMLQQGIEVTCSLDAEGREIPPALIAKPGLRLRKVFNTELSVSTWSLLLSSHQPTLQEMVGCQLPDTLPPQFGVPTQRTNVLRECVASESLLAVINSLTRWRQVTMIDPKWTLPLDGLTLTKFVHNEEILGQTPLTIPVTSGSRPMMVPTYATEQYSRWEVSIRPLLLDSSIATEATANRTNVPGHLRFDSDGRLTEVGVTPTRDCPATIPWVTLPDVEHLHVNLVASSYDGRTSSNDARVVEEVGFQSAAFSKLSRATIYAHPPQYFNLLGVERQTTMYDHWDARFEKFLRELLKHPGLIEVQVDGRFNPYVWRLLAESESIERLVVDTNYDMEILWLDMLSQFPKLKEVVVMAQISPQGTRVPQANQARLLAMKAYMANLLGGPPVALPTDGIDELEEYGLEGEALDRDVENTRLRAVQELEDAQKSLLPDWTKLIQSAVPHVRVSVVPPPTRPWSSRWP
ncbi:MAG: hypothetical protein Q8M16_17705 [Pirellulaceae bacterium]|nr:hypothetical protein [Pirellulaceae bacterium]